MFFSTDDYKFACILAVFVPQQLDHSALHDAQLILGEKGISCTRLAWNVAMTRIIFRSDKTMCKNSATYLLPLLKCTCIIFHYTWVLLEHTLQLPNKMGLLTDPKNRQKAVTFISNHSTKVCVLCYIGGLAWFLALAYRPLNAGTYFSENALLPGE